MTNSYVPADQKQMHRETAGLSVRDGAALFFFLVAVAIAICVCGMRSPFGTPTGSAMIQCVTTVGGVLFLWCELSRRFPEPWAASGATMAIFLPALTLGQGFAGAGVSLFFVVTILLGSTRTIGTLIRHPRIDYLVLLAAPLLGVGYFVYANPPSFNVLRAETAMLGAIGPDPVYHAAIASMISYHGAISTGLDGLVLQHYHFLSHFWLGFTSRWLGVPVMDAYYLVPQIVGIPLFLFAFVNAAVGLARKLGSRSDAGLRAILVPLLLLALSDFMNWNSYLISESYLLATIIMLLWFPALLRAFDLRSNPALYVVLAIAGTLMIPAKISVGLIWFSMLGYITARRLISRTDGLAGQLLVALPTLAVTMAAAAITALFILPSGYEPLQANSYLLTYPKVFLSSLITIIVGAISILAIVGTPRDLVRSGWVAVLIAIAISVAVPLTINLASSEYYFMDVGCKLSLIAASAYLLSRTNIVYTIRNSTIIAACLVLAWTAMPERFLALRELIYSANILAEKVASYSTVEPQGQFDLEYSAKWLPLAPGAQVIDYLAATVGYGQPDVLIFAPPSNTKFWQISEGCIARPFLVPALLALPMLNGIPPADGICDATYQAFYGFDHYGPSSQALEMSDPALCEKAIELGFGSVFVLTSLSNGRWLHCN